jgi:hypothetical protein
MGKQEKSSHKKGPGSGNGCEHKPEKPRVPSLPTGQYRPNIIMELALGLGIFYRNPDLFPELDATNGSKRQMRSERREACWMLSVALFYYCDAGTRTVAIPMDDGTLLARSMLFFAFIGGLSIRRAWRAFKNLLASKFFYREGGLIKVSLNYIRRLEDLTSRKVQMALEFQAKKNAAKRRRQGKPPVDEKKIERDKESARIAATREMKETPEERVKRMATGREQMGLIMGLLRGGRASPGQDPATALCS